MRTTGMFALGLGALALANHALVSTPPPAPASVARVAGDVFEPASATRRSSEDERVHPGDDDYGMFLEVDSDLSGEIDFQELKAAVSGILYLSL